MDGEYAEPSEGRLLPFSSWLGSVQFRFLRIRTGSWLGFWLPILLRRIFRSAFGLDVRSVEHPIAPVLALSQRLRVVFECVRRGLAAAVDHRNHPSLFHQLKLQLCSLALDRSGRDVAGYAQTLAVSLGAHAVEFLNGDVITLAVLHARVGEIGQRNHDNHNDRAEAQILAILC